MSTKRIGWITNVCEKNAERIARELLVGNKNRVISIGNPAPTKQHDKNELMKMGIAGLYDCDPEMIDQLKGFKHIFYNREKKQ